MQKVAPRSSPCREQIRPAQKSPQPMQGLCRDSQRQAAAWLAAPGSPTPGLEADWGAHWHGQPRALTQAPQRAPAFHSVLSSTSWLFTCAAVSMRPRHSKLLPYMTCSAIILIHNTLPNPSSLALHKLSRSGVQLLSSNFA